MSRDQVPTAKQARFIAEYLKDLNGSDAAVRAGYRPSSARHTASRLLQQGPIKAAVQQLQAQQLEKVRITAEGVLEQLRRIAFFDIRDIYEESIGESRDGTEGSSIQWRMKHPADWPAEARTALASYDSVIRNIEAGDALVDTVLKVKLESKLTALELLAKHLNLLTERSEDIRELRITWLAPEPPPPAVEVVDSNGAPSLTQGSRTLPSRTEEEMGFDKAPGAPSERTRSSSFSDSSAEPSSSVHRSSPPSDDDPMDAEEQAIQTAMEEYGMGRAAVLRLLPELRPAKTLRR